jgi:hypothetical protein
MTPAQLKPESFQSYQPEARSLAEQYLALLRTLPLSFLPLLLREVIAYDRKFPAERRELDYQFRYLASLPEAAREKELAPFRAIRVEGDLQQMDWVRQPARFSEALSAHLWSTHQIDGFHRAAVAYMDRASASLPMLPPKIPRLTIAVIGQGVLKAEFPLFRKLRAHGVSFLNMSQEGGLAAMAGWLGNRAAQIPDRYAHWSISGGTAAAQPGITTISYEGLAQPRAAMSAVLRKSFEGGMGSEALRTRLAAMKPADIGLAADGDAAATWFQLSLLSEGSGTQIFSTSFVQWAAREALRRAEPLTMLCRYTPRVQSSSMKDLLTPDASKAPVLDAKGSLVDADMAAYQTWLNVQRLPGASEGTFLCWFEGHGDLLAIAPNLKPGTTDNRSITFQQLATDLRLA